MKVYQQGETAMVYFVVTKSGALYDPSTSVTCSIWLPSGTLDVNASAMTKESTGKYYYDYQTASKALGVYRARCTATDGTPITIEEGFFEVQQ